MTTIVETTNGKVSGSTEHALLAFKGIPFAAPPVGPLRWRAPQPVESWTGVRDGSVFGNCAPQVVMPRLEGADFFPQSELGAPLSEDCLYLNVYTPAADDGRRPVMVWIHGGNFSMGSGSDTGARFRTLVHRGDVVMVSINYRLGALGFVHLKDVCGDGFDDNVGLRDQIAALRWVKDNIAAFGGDPSNVTIFGVSAGGMSVGALLGTPSAMGLFRRAIPQSGAAHNVHTREASSRVAHGFLKTLGIDAGDATALREVPADKIVEAQETFYNLLERFTRPGEWTTDDSGAYSPAYQPAADGDILPGSALDFMRSGGAKDVSVLVGNTLEEQKMGASFDPFYPDTFDDLSAAVAERVPATRRDGRADAVAEVYRRVREASQSPREIFSVIETDRIFRIPAVRVAELQSAHQPQTYSYVFCWQSPYPVVGAAHGMDMPFLFGRLDEPGMAAYAGDGPDANRLADVVQDAWLSFARDGIPTSAGLETWPAYDLSRRATMMFGPKSHIENAPNDAERAVWDGIL